MHCAVIAAVATLVLSGGRVTRALRDGNGKVRARLVAPEDGGGGIEWADGGFESFPVREPDCVPDAGEFDRLAANNACNVDGDCVVRHSHYAGIPCCYVVSRTVGDSAAFDAALGSLVAQCGYDDGICLPDCARAVCRKKRCVVVYAESD